MDGSSTAASSSDRPQSDAGTAPVTMKRPPAEVFNKTLLKYYYQNFFPFRLFYKWLSYDNDPAKTHPGNKPNYFFHREFTFTLEGDIFVRYLCFHSADELARATLARLPERIELGPVYTASPDKHLTLKKEVFKPVERELIFDIDLNDYDDIRTCCTGAAICKRCWAFMNTAIRVLEKTLTEDFGFQHMMFVYSGRRGVHCWVSDESARSLTDEQRAAVAEYLNAMSGDAGTAGAANSGGGGGTGGGGGAPNAQNATFNKIINGLTVPLHPVFARAASDLERIFEQYIIAEEGQGILAKPEAWNKLLGMLPDFPDVEKAIEQPLTELIRAAWEEEGSDPVRRWRQLKSTVGDIVERSGGTVARRDGGGGKGKGGPPPEFKIPFHVRAQLEKLIPAIVFTYCYPRLDINVSKKRNHLLKMPFCVHPKTGRICVPIDTRALDSFNPSEVPTVTMLMEEGLRAQAAARAAAAAASASAAAEDDDAEMTSVGVGGGGGAGAGGAAARPGTGGGVTRGGVNLENELYKSTSMRPYIEQFEGFLRDLYTSIARVRREEREKMAALTGDF